MPRPIRFPVQKSEKFGLSRKVTVPLTTRPTRAELKLITEQVGGLVGLANAIKLDIERSRIENLLATFRKQALADFKSTTGREPNPKEMKQINSQAYQITDNELRNLRFRK